MRIEKNQTPAATVLRIFGEIDLHTTPALRVELQKCSGERVPQLLLDLSGVEYIDSGGLAALIEYTKESLAFGGKLMLIAVPKKVLAVFELVRLDKFFTILPDEASALERIDAEAAIR
jgi:anti-sigma B factor antagonist